MKTFKFMLIVMFLVLALAGCVSSSEEPAAQLINPGDHVVIAVANHSNTALPNLEAASDILTELIIDGGKLSIVCIDGAPYMVNSVQVKAIDKGYSKTVGERIIKNRLSEINTYINTAAVPLTAEANYLEALDLCMRVKGDEPGPIIILGSFLSTEGLDLGSMLSNDTSSSEMVEALKASGQTVDLKGNDIFVFGLGCVEAPQPDLGLKGRARLEECVRSLLGYCNAGEITVDTSPSPMAVSSSANKPPVSVVEIAEETVTFDQLNKGIDVSEADGLRFKGDIDRLIDEAAALETLTPIAELIRNSGQKVILLGSTASVGDADSAKQLSFKRAETVKRLLVDLGVREENISCIGLGYDDSPYRVEDKVNGVLDETLAAQNRKVVIISSESYADMNK